MVDVAVVGAGAAGLACAQRLRAAGLSPLVLEARTRVGGRILTAYPAGPEFPVELGAQVIHGDRAACWEFVADPNGSVSYGEQAPLAVRLGGGLYPAPQLMRKAGCLLWASDIRLRGCAPDDVPAAVVLRSLGARFGVDDEWVRQTWAGDPAVLSAKGMADVLAMADSGEGQFIVRGGFSTLADQMAVSLDIRLGWPVEQISWASGGVQLHSGDDSVSARCCVVTLPPPVVSSGRCAISPFPAGKIAAARALGLGDAVSVAVTFSRPLEDPVLVFDADGEAGFWKAERGSPAVLGVAKDSAAAKLRVLAADPGRLRGLLQQLFPDAADCLVEDVRVVDWGRDPWAMGAFTFPRAGQLDAPAQWAQPLGDAVFFAGEATCGARHPASVHGAIESGVRAAGEVLAAVGS